MQTSLLSLLQEEANLVIQFNMLDRQVGELNKRIAGFSDEKDCGAKRSLIAMYMVDLASTLQELEQATRELKAIRFTMYYNIDAFLK